MGSISYDYGYTRVVLMIFGIVIKFPRLGLDDRRTVLGMYANLHEWEVWQDAQRSGGSPHLARCYFRLPFGLALVQKRYRRLAVSAMDYGYFMDIEHVMDSVLSAPDYNPLNYAYDDNWQVVCLDYGHPNCWYIGDAIEQEIADHGNL